ncbi:Xylose isomerase domain protein TIM barrel [Methanocaldococcus vulcanius M7]|uniref:Xylose isomerase domain protein TIM barrel n=1 Tax=Methanocaldococcus vulcanius (strain ATCC 700851 / DSM 12094 / M7) TaxID=579137 RepID=C9RG76_METVM|nr:TIM barrel protein [Methanocaldococcus vulcanius]ACX72578.1 Xylose isomerase domain protein TIM barrel [Methanocaldococcus vulcanius M7]
MIAICMRYKDKSTFQDKFKNKLVDWGLHFYPKIVKEKNIIGYHAPILNLDKKDSVFILKNIIQTIDGCGYLTVHLHNGKNKTVNRDDLIENLSIVNDFADKKGIKLCIENLRKGFSSNPDNLIDIADEVDCHITYDVGHIPYNKRLEFLEICSDRIYNAHIYEIEINGKHLPPKDLKNLRPILDELLNIKCKLFLIELMEIESILKTEKMLIDYFNSVDNHNFSNKDYKI